MSWPTTSNPRTEFVTLRLTVDEAADLDWLGGVTNGRNRSDTMRKALDRVISAEKRRAKKTRKAGKPTTGVMDDD